MLLRKPRFAFAATVAELYGSELGSDLARKAHDATISNPTVTPPPPAIQHDPTTPTPKEECVTVDNEFTGEPERICSTPAFQ